VLPGDHVPVDSPQPLRDQHEPLPVPFPDQLHHEAIHVHLRRNQRQCLALSKPGIQLRTSAVDPRLLRQVSVNDATSFRYARIVHSR